MSQLWREGREEKIINTRRSRTCRVEVGRGEDRGRGESVYVKAGKRRKGVVKATERGDIGDILTRSAN